jgi:hypothetical protein
MGLTLKPVLDTIGLDRPTRFTPKEKLMPAVDNFITNIEKDTRTSKAGKPFSIWYATLDDGRRIKFGFNKPPYELGQRLTGSAEPNKFGDLEFSGPGAAPAAAKIGSGPSATGPVATGGRTFPVATTSPEMSIIRQNALTNANAALDNFLSHGQWTLEADTPEAYAEAVIELAYKFAEFSSGQREAKRVKAMTE